MNISYSSHWKSENIKEETFQKVLAFSKKNNVQVSVGGYHIYRLIWSYYNCRNGSFLSQINQEAYPNHEDDFMVTKAENLQELLCDYTIIDSNSVSGITLLQRKNILEKSLIKTFEIANKFKNTKDEYINFVNDSILIQDYKSLKMRFLFNLENFEKYSSCVLVVNTFDSLHNSIRYSYLELDWQGVKSKKQTYDLSISIPENPDSTKYLVAYLWNPKQKTITLSDAKLEIFTFGKNTEE